MNAYNERCTRWATNFFNIGSVALGIGILGPVATGHRIGIADALYWLVFSGIMWAIAHALLGIVKED